MRERVKKMGKREVERRERGGGQNKGKSEGKGRGTEQGEE